MTVILDQKDTAKLDKRMSSESQVYDLLKQGAKDVTVADFVGAKEVRINKMKGFTASQYKRNQDNGRVALSIEKETVKLTQEDWFGYDFDALDESESAALAISNALEEHKRLITIPNKDRHAVSALLKAAERTDADEESKLVKETITSANALKAFDQAEQYMTDAEVTGQFVMFASSDYYASLKNADGVSKTFSVNSVELNGINRKVAQLDGDTLIAKVAKGRLQVSETKQINFILVPLNVAAPIDKFNTVDLVPASSDRNGYRDTVKGLDYFDVIVLDNALPAIYVSYTDKVPGA